MAGDMNTMWEELSRGTGEHSIFNVYTEKAGFDIEYVRRAKMYKLAWYSVFIDGCCR